jgi:SAM-dependent methyltransferase
MFEPATLSGVVAPRGFTPEGNFLAGGAARRLVEVDRVYDDAAVVWQEAVYAVAREVADAGGHRRVVDIGTGSGVKLHTTFAGHPAVRLQTDWRDARIAPPGGAPQPDFLAVNLEDFHDLEALEAALDPGDPTLFILSDVIEHLQDPRPLLRTLRRLLKRHAGNRLVISTPDRHRVDGAGAEGIPDNRGHVRQWTLNEFGLAMLACGFEVRRIGRLPQNEHDPHGRTTCCELSCTPERHAAWLASHGLPPAADHLVLTTEHARAARTGGIGTYIQLAQEADGLPRLILFAGGMGLPEAGWAEAARANGWIHVSDICGRGARPLHEVAAPDADEILQAVLQALFLYDEVRLIEYQDYLGIGHRVAQAKRAGLLPPSVTVMAFAHGNHLYLDAAGGEVTGTRPPGTDARERLAVELADVVAFPSRYIRDLYVGMGGFRMRAERHLPLPILIHPTGLDDLSRGPIRNLVFYGKQTPQKGFHDFVDAVLALFSDPAHADAAARVQRVVLMGVTDADPRLSALPVRVEHGVWSRAEAVDMLRGFAPDSLLVLPYRGDNHPLSVFEVVGHDCQLLAFDIGGVPELLPEELREQLLCAPDALSLAQGMARACRLTHWERCRLVEATRRRVSGIYWDHAATYRATIAELKRGQPPRPRAAEPGAVTVVVPNLNGTRELLEDAATGLRNSFHRPARVILADDGSTPEGLAVLEASVAAFGDIPTEVVRNPRNLGLAATRNVGLERAETPYLCPHDNDNILLNRFLQTACRILDDNPEVAAVTTWSWYFEDGKPWQKAGAAGADYRPVGADLGLSLRVNAFGDALGVYRVSDLRAVGGWGGESKAKWEDWQLFLRLLAAGKDVWVIPQPNLLYRVRQGSMLRSYPDFPAWLRLADALPGIPREQAVSLLRALWTPSAAVGTDLVPLLPKLRWLETELHETRHALEALRHGHAAGEQGAQAELARLRAIESSTIWRATTRVRLALAGHPTLRRALRAPLAAAWRGARTVRNRIRGG